MMYRVFQRDRFDYFRSMMPAKQHHITVETPTFLSSLAYIMAMYNMQEDWKEEPEVGTLSGRQRCSDSASS